MEAPVVPLFSTATVALGPLAASQGTWKLICCWPLTLSTANSATGWLLMITASFKNIVGSGSDEVRLMPGPEGNLVPNAVAIAMEATLRHRRMGTCTAALTAGAGPWLQVQVSPRAVIPTKPPNRTV